ncbi:uncharacterized protein LOC117102114 [Anneissia japonica]|uniref:uncharacterized protein LOC117102114 n=1 Tax=Anneissia japonica TaxID=1529436 RepID=UPI0014256FCD|nr:uncharacterized protein LOC117102114 [Anneissia japonica]
MCHRTVILMITLAICLKLKVCVGVDLPNDLAEFLYNRIPELQGQARPRQFAALIFLDQTEVENLTQFQFNPRHDDGTPYVNNNVAFSPPSPQNYMVARPFDGYHAEEHLLYELQTMWNNYINQGNRRRPAMIILFTRLYPCSRGTRNAHECAEQIRDSLAVEPYRSVPSRVLVYNDDDESPADQFIQNFNFLSADIIPQPLNMGSCFNSRTSRAIKMPRDAHDTCTEPSVIQSLQGCVLQCLGDGIYSCFEVSAGGTQKAYLMNILLDKCLLNEQREICFKETFLKETGAACTLLQKKIIVDHLATCHQKCNLKPISKPCQDAWDFDNHIALLTSAEERKQYKQPTTFGCKDIRRTGLLCTYLDDKYLTAGNSLCKADHPCGTYGYSYTWCYTSISGNWDYCCTGTCGYQGYKYLWCNSGSTWQYCGKGGTIPTGTRTSKTPHPCLADHPCGLHYDVSTKNEYFWCYVDTTLEWDYCCSPQPVDNVCTYNQQTDYKWCKTSYYKNTGGEWRYCYY